jgi:hypothetical protein
MNGLTHGLTASTLILPSEKAADFERRMDEVCKVLLPRNEVERMLVFSTVRASWLLERADRVQTARVAAIIESAPDREQEETYELGKRLFFNNNGPLQTWGVLHYNFTTERTSYSRQPVHPDDPDTLVRKLCKTASGCRWLLDEWARLRALVEPGNSWQAMDKFKATRLLSRQPADCIWDRTIAELWLRTWTINAQRETAWVELKSEMSSEEYRYVRKTITWMWPDMLDSNDQATERQIVISIIDRAVDEIKAKAANVAERAERDAKRLADCLSFDDSDAGDRIRKYEQAHQRTMFRSLRELYKTRAETEEVEPSYVEGACETNDAGEGGEAPDATNAPDAAYLRSREHAYVQSAQGRDGREDHCGGRPSDPRAADRHADPDFPRDRDAEIPRPIPDDRYDPNPELQLPITDIPYDRPAEETGAAADNGDRRGCGNDPWIVSRAAIELLLSLILLLTCATPSAASRRGAAGPTDKHAISVSSVPQIGGKAGATVASDRSKNLGPEATCQIGSAESRGATEKSERSAGLALPAIHRRVNPRMRRNPAGRLRQNHRFVVGPCAGVTTATSSAATVGDRTVHPWRLATGSRRHSPRIPKFAHAANEGRPRLSRLCRMKSQVPCSFPTDTRGCLMTTALHHDLVSPRIHERLRKGQLTEGQVGDFRDFLEQVERDLLHHRIINDNRYTRWFRDGQATDPELVHFVKQFSVFSNQFLIAALLRVINAPSLQQARSAKEILLNELGVIYRPTHGGEATSTRAVDEESKDRVGDPDLVSTEGTVDGGTFRFRAAHFEWLIGVGEALGLGFQNMGKRRHGRPYTLTFCDELARLYGSEDDRIAEGASFAVENWAAAGFWQELEDGLLKIKATRIHALKVAFFTWHNRVEAQHAEHTMDELEDVFFAPKFDQARFFQGGREVLDAIAVFWDGLEEDRKSGVVN